MANNIKGEVVVMAGGKAWTLLCDMNALCEFEAKAGKSSTEFLEAIEESKDFKMTDLRILVWAMLLEHHPDATIRDAGKVMSADGDAFQKALDFAFPDAESVEDDAVPGEVKAARD